MSPVGFSPSRSGALRPRGVPQPPPCEAWDTIASRKLVRDCFGASRTVDAQHQVTRRVVGE